MSLHAYHPETGNSSMVTAEALAHMRVSGWMLRSEYDANQAAAEQAQAASDAEAAKSAAKTAKN